MPKYDFHCATCDTVAERVCRFDDRPTQRCENCDSLLEPLFSPTTNIVACPQAFKYTFGELYGTSSEKDWLKDNPHATRINPSTFRTRRQQDESRWAKANKEAADVERALRANASLTASPKKKSRRSA